MLLEMLLYVITWRGHSACERWGHILMHHASLCSSSPQYLQTVTTFAVLEKTLANNRALFSLRRKYSARCFFLVLWSSEYNCLVYTLHFIQQQQQQQLSLFLVEYRTECTRLFILSSLVSFYFVLLLLRLLLLILIYDKDEHHKRNSIRPKLLQHSRKHNRCVCHHWRWLPVRGTCSLLAHIHTPNTDTHTAHSIREI